ncbi:putative methyltransferase PMT27 [Hordeum vulgare]|nr:putative methyltransferase PMT27 [Hordeum vulgare]
MALPVAPMALPMDKDDNDRKFTMHHVVDTHMRGKDLSVVYTNEPDSVESTIQTMEQLLAEDKYQVVGFELEFTSGRAEQVQKSSLVELASAIIDPYYMKMKDERQKDKNTWHNSWDQRLEEEHVKYAAKDAYTSYAMYMRIADMRKCLRPDRDEGSTQRAVSERHKK